MKYISTKNKNESGSFKEATFKGLASERGLFVPEKIPQLSTGFLDQLTELSDLEIATEVLSAFVAPDISRKELEGLLADAINFEAPVVKVEEQIHCLELFHGPTLAFKDFGARFMSRCMGFFNKDTSKDLCILVATSGDTGSAVANGFWKIPGVKVIVLFPKGGVSAFQEEQMCTLGENIFPLEVDGTFDDCQNLVKTAFMDVELNKHMNLSSANSINIARLLPQMLYYFFAVKQLKGKAEKLLVSVPSGNLGNLTSGLIAKKMGLPIHRFVSACNANRTFSDYLEDGMYYPKPSVATFSNAMDVGDPSNFERILYLYNNDLDSLRKHVSGMSITDEETLYEIKSTYGQTKYLLDPHGAVGKIALQRELKPDETGLFLATAHPKKFDKVMKMALPEVKLFDSEGYQPSVKTSMLNNYKNFKEYVLGV